MKSAGQQPCAFRAFHKRNRVADQSKSRSGSIDFIIVFLTADGQDTFRICRKVGTSFQQWRQKILLFFAQA